MTTVYRTNLHLAGIPAGLAGKARGSFALAIHAGGPVRATASSAFVDGIHTGLLYAAGAALIAATTVAVLLSSGLRRRHPVSDGELALASSASDGELALASSGS